MINTLSTHANLIDDLGQSTDITHLYWVVDLTKCLPFYNWSEYPKIQETNSPYEDKCYIKCCGGTTIHQPINTLTFLSMQSSKILSHMLKIQYMLRYSVKPKSWYSHSQRSRPTVNFKTAEGWLTEEGLIFLTWPSQPCIRKQLKCSPASWKDHRKHKMKEPVNTKY